MMKTKKTFMIMDCPLVKIGDIRPMVEKWCKSRDHKLLRIWYGVEGNNQTIDQVQVEYEH